MAPEQGPALLQRPLQQLLAAIVSSQETPVVEAGSHSSRCSMLSGLQSLLLLMRMAYLACHASDSLQNEDELLSTQRQGTIPAHAAGMY